MTDRRSKIWWGAWTIAMLIVAVMVSVSGVVVASPASQPASQPVGGIWGAVQAWWAANWCYVIFGALIPSLITGLRDKSLRAGVVGFGERLLERFSLATPKDSPGTFKLPGPLGKPPVKPEG